MSPDTSAHPTSQTRTAHAPDGFSASPSRRTRRTSAGVLRRVRSIAMAEARLFLRNRTIAATALGLPLVMVVFFAAVGDTADGAAFSTYLANTLLQWGLLLVVFYNLTTIFVARREDGVFQRMSTGEATPWEALSAASLPSLAVLLVQVVAGGTAAILAFGAPAMTNPLFILAAIALGSIIMVALAAWTSSFTTTVEGAQYSTLPGFFILMLLSGLTFPLDLLPEGLRTLATFTPLHAVAELVSVGMNGSRLGEVSSLSFQQSWGEGLRPLGVLVIWTVVTLWLARATMRFTRRR